MATFYFKKPNPSAANWQTLGNWWLDRAGTIPATNLPTSSDDVVMIEVCSENTGSEPTVNTAILEDNFSINLTVTNGMTVIIASEIYGSIITGNVIFEDDTLLNSGTINGNASFTENSRNILGTATGTIIYNGFTGTDGLGITYTNGRVSKFYWDGSVDNNWQTLGNWWLSSSDDYTFQPISLPTSSDDVVIKTNTLSANSGGPITVNNLTIQGVLDLITITVSTLCIVEGALYGNINGNVRSIGYSQTGGIITGNLEMRDYSYSYVGQNGTNPLGGNLHCMDNAEANLMTVAGNALFEDDSFISGGLLRDFSSGGFEVYGNLEMRNSSYNVGSIRCEGAVTFSDTAKNHGLYQETYYQGIVIALSGCYFLDNTGPYGSDYTQNLTDGFVVTDYIPPYYTTPLIMSHQATINVLSFINGVGSVGPISFVYDKGVNGSSILGVV